MPKTIGKEPDRFCTERVTFDTFPKSETREDYYG